MKNDIKKINIREAKETDFEELYALGKNTPEFRVSATEEFMHPEEFRWSLTDASGVFLVAEVGEELVGFIFANSEDLGRPYPEKYSCLVYLVVVPEFQKQGIAKMLYDECVKRLKTKGITHMYGLASAESNGAIIAFMKNQGFAKGHTYTWMDKKL